jgi:hypothetical protein
MASSDGLARRLADRSARRAAPTVGAQPTRVKVTICPRCGAPRTKSTGLTRCAYCDYSFLDVTVTNGIFLTDQDNSR